MSNTERTRESTIGQRVYARRLAKGLTQEQLAARTGLSPGHISEIENGVKKNLQHKTLKKLVKGLEISIMELLGDDEEGDKSDGN